jgi:hypothetical protein
MVSEVAGKKVIGTFVREIILGSNYGETKTGRKSG